MQAMQRAHYSVASAIAGTTKARPRTQIRCRPHIHTQRPHARTFASFPANYAIMPQSSMPANISKLMPPQQAMKSRMKRMPKSEIPNDFGLLPQTIVRPPNRELPPFFGKSMGRRLRIEWYWIKTRVQNFLAIYYMCRWTPRKDYLTGKKMKIRMRMEERTAAARALHEAYYTALAKGDFNEISRIACTGLVQTSKIRIDHRKALGLPTQTFQILKYSGIRWPYIWPKYLTWPIHTILPFSASRVVSDRMTFLPLGKDSFLRQCIVRVKSRQSLDKNDGKGAKVADLTEYVVIQKLKINADEQPWKLWGTVKPNSMKDISAILDESVAANKGLGLSDRITAQASQAFGG